MSASRTMKGLKAKREGEQKDLKWTPEVNDSPWEGGDEEGGGKGEG